MLLVEWFAWWTEITSIRADEHLDAYMVHMLGDSGWTMDREHVLEAWRQMARRESSGTSNGSTRSVKSNDPRLVDDIPSEELRKQFNRTREWLRFFYGGGIAN